IGDTTQQIPPIQLQQVQRTVGIMGGPHGIGTGIFVTVNGLIATTRFVVGGEVNVKVELLDRRLIQGQVVRSFPEFDLALIKVNVQIPRLLISNPNPNLPDNLPIVAITHAGQVSNTT